MIFLPPERLTDQGWATPSLWLYLLMALCGRTWWLLIVAAISREHGSELLALFYPSRTDFYLGLAIGLCPALLLWCQGFRQHNRIAAHLWYLGQPMLLLTMLADLTLQLRVHILSNGQFSWGPAILFMLTIWATWYLLQSRDTRTVFKLRGQQAARLR
ncbi:DUF2919 domain-containing protein [Ferrimonas pelagia]|uniref:DUF2919 domain-containing protein n=1 Tax=Ferrimonas pelagia TaxID=1177826 RepID=A0ABP9FBC6_9GAMM